MKKVLSLLLVFAMLFSLLPLTFVCAEEMVLEDMDDDDFEDIEEDEFADVNTSAEYDNMPDREGRVVLNAEEKRGIKLQPVGENEVEDGISPTTGLALDDYDVPSGFGGLAATGHYQPILVQIDNTNGGVNYDTNNTAPWGASYADIVYETPLHKSGFTRISFLFSDQIPTGDGSTTWGVGPVRSARVGHCWLREEWNAGFLFYGGQTYPGSSINDVFSQMGLSRKTGKNAAGYYVLFDGTVGESKSHPWKQYYNRRPGVVAPHNVWADVASMAALISDDNDVPNHAYIFTDDVPDSNDFAEDIYINWYIQYSSHLVYDFDSNAYFRYMVYPNGVEVPYEDRDSGELMSFNNVIIQFTPTTYTVADAPTTTTIGEGNADFFMGGVHVAGYWKRDSEHSRTVFYGPDGNEMPMQRGRTLIVLYPYNNEQGKTVSYE